jgi:Txe/YoeB family toxin of Txe-Axe toxin-antitoxin module
VAIQTDTEAKEIITDLMNTAVNDTINIKARIEDLKKDYETDVWDITKAQIDRLEVRLARRVKEAAALAIAVTKF